MLTGYLIALLFMLCLTAGVFLFGYTSRKAAAGLITFLEVVIGFALISFILLAYEGLSFKHLFTGPSLHNWIYLGLAAIASFVGGNYFSLLNLKWGGELLNSLLSAGVTATVVLLSVAFNSDMISFWQTCGIVITICAVSFFLWLSSDKELQVVNHSKAVWSSLGVIICISASIVFLIKGGSVGNLSIFHVLWLRLLMALPLVTFFLLIQKKVFSPLNSRFYITLICAIILQTVLGSWLWFAANTQIGVPVFQTIIATLPLWVYVADVYVMKRSKPSAYFLVTALLAIMGIWMAMR